MQTILQKQINMVKVAIGSLPNSSENARTRSEILRGPTKKNFRRIAWKLTELEQFQFIRLRYASNTPQIRLTANLKYASDTSQIRLRYASNMPQIRLKYGSETPQIRLRNASNTPQISLKYASDTPQTRLRYASLPIWNTPQIRLRYA